MIYKKLSQITIAALTLLSIACCSASELTKNFNKLSQHDGCEIANYKNNITADFKEIKEPFPPIGLQVHTQVEPIAFVNEGRHYLIYELHLQNFTSESLSLLAIEVLSNDKKSVSTITSFKDTSLSSALRPAGIDNDEESRDLLKSRQGITAFLCVQFNEKENIPSSIFHKIVLKNGIVITPNTRIQTKELAVIGSPLIGSDWIALHGPHISSHHRRGLWINNGSVENSRRFAIDFRKTKNNTWYSGDARDVNSYYAYGEKIIAVADGTIVLVKDGYPDNVPRTSAGFTPATEINMESIAGNTVVIDIGGGQFASYAHMQAGSILVKLGEKVKRGQTLGLLGNSGDSRSPHLHFQISTSQNHLLHGEGMPFLIDSFRRKISDGQWQTRQLEYPWGDTPLIDFGIR